MVVAFGLGLALPPPAHAAPPARPYDFDGNGRPDLVVGAPTLRVGAVLRAGGVFVLPASGGGLSLAEQVVTQSSAGVPGGSESGDAFGSAVASADFDLDGRADLAVGQPGEDGGDGGVTVVYGSATGLDTTRSARIGGTGEFGSTLVAGDFTLDGYPDLAVGAPDAEVELPDEEDFAASGTVTVLPGGAGGLATGGGVVLRRQGYPDFDSSFGSTLAAGDLDLDGDTDLVVGAEGVRGVDDRYPGTVSYCPAAPGGPTGCPRLVRGPQPLSLAVGNVSGDRRPEIVLGEVEPEDRTGDVVLLRLAAGDPVTLARQDEITQYSPGVPGSTEVDDSFGASLVVGNVDRDGYDDLVIGSPGEAIGDLEGAGRVTVVHGAAGGYRTTGNYTLDQGTPGVPGAAEQSDEFGAAATLLDHDGDGRLDLTVGATGENSGAGAVTTLPGGGSGPTTTGARTFGLRTLDYPYPGSGTFGAPLGR